MFDCPKCVTVCKQPHCVTHCQAPKPECEAVCEEPKCDWKCHKPNCPKPKCELVCENPNCSPKVECCPCNSGSLGVMPSFPFFKETENNKRCCGCDNKRHGSGAPSEYPSVVGVDSGLTNTMPSSAIIDSSSQLYRVDKRAKVTMLKNPRALGTGQYTNLAAPNSPEYLAAKDHINLNMAYNDRVN